MPTNVTNRKSMLVVDENSTPYRAGAGANGATQRFTADAPLNEYTGTGAWKSTWNIGFQTASLPPSLTQTNLWRATPTWAFHALFLTETIDSVDIDWNTGARHINKIDVRLPGTATCVGLPVAVSVKRAHNVR